MKKMTRSNPFKIAAVFLILSIGFPARADSPVSQSELLRGISSGLSQVEEFGYIREEAAKMGITHAYLFGGTAAGYAHYIRWNLQREKGDSRFQPDRFDFDYTNIYRSTQDLDIVIDGTPEQAQELQTALQKKYPHLQGSKSAWEVRLLKAKLGEKEALLDNPDYLNQHTDSNSTGMIEITPSKDPVVRDLRDWNSASPQFLKDLEAGNLHYYASELHQTTHRFLLGRNPPILSVIRYLTKAFQYELEISPEDEARIKKVIDAFDPHGEEVKNSYVAGWIEKNGSKLIKNAVNIEYAWNKLERLGLRQKLIQIKNNPKTIDSLAFWMNKEPLRTKPIGQGTGKTARELGVDVVAHETNNFLAYESITRAHTGDANVLISRVDGAGESAALGEGFYTAEGRSGARGTGLTIRFHLNPDARDGTDFIKKGYILRVLNKAALKVIPESLNMGVVEYFEMITSEGALDGSDRGILEKLKRRLNREISSLSPEQEQQIFKMIEHEADQPNPRWNVLREWFSLPISTHYSQIVDHLIKTDNDETNKRIVNDILVQPHWSEHPEWVETLMRRNHTDYLILDEFLAKAPWATNHPEWVRHYIEKDPMLHQRIIQNILPGPGWSKHPELVEELIKKGREGGPIYSMFNHVNLAMFVLSQPEWKDHPELVEMILDGKKADHQIAQYILSKPYWKNPAWLETLVKRRGANGYLARDVLTQPHWAEDPVLKQLCPEGISVLCLITQFQKGFTFAKPSEGRAKCVVEELRESL